MLAFLASVGPGYVYVRIRENWKPYVERTPFREAAQIVVTGSLATIVGVVVTLNMGRVLGFLDIDAFAQAPGHYLATHPLAAGWSALGVLLVSYGLAALVARYGPSRGARVFPDSGWYAAFERQLPENHGIKATVELRDGRKIAGVIQAFTAEQTPVDDRELTLVRATGTPMQVLSQDGQVANLAEDFIVLQGSDILYIAATFVPTQTA